MATNKSRGKAKGASNVAPKKKPAKPARKAPGVTVEMAGIPRNVAPRGFFAKIMMPISPLTPDTEPPEPGLTFLTNPEEYERIARSQKAYFEELADKLITDAPLEELLNTFDRVWAAGAIRAYASQIPLAEPRLRGQRPKVDPGAVALQYALKTIKQGTPKSVAIAELAEEWDVSDEAIRKALKKHGNTAVTMLSNLKEK